MNLPTREIREGLKIINGDCMEVMKQYEDNYFDLAVVDPPYGDACNLKGGSSSSGKNGWSGMMRKANKWNKEPEDDYFKQLFRVSKNQIIWGANHFISKIPYNFSCFLIWDKGQRDFSLADGELAWASFNKSARFFTYARAKALQEGKIHPTQKPIALYNWIYKNYAQEGQKILDTHGGSFSSAISAHYARMGEFVGCELDEDYFNAGVERIIKETRQLEFEF